jgi:Sec-independent protein secretion pathway component TatC
MSESEVPVVACDPLPQLVLSFALALLYVLELAPVAAGFGLLFQYPILSAGGTVSEVTERLFFEWRMAMVMLLVGH